MANNDYYTRLEAATHGAISIAVPQVDFPDPVNVAAKFTYNFFEPDEMTPGSSATDVQDPLSSGETLGQTYVGSRTRSGLDSTSTSDQDAGFFSVQTQRFPMYNEISWSESTVNNPAVDKALVDDIAGRLSDLIYLAESEESFSSSIYTGYTVSPVNVYEEVQGFYDALTSTSSGFILEAMVESTSEGKIYSSSMSPFEKINEIYKIVFGETAGFTDVKDGDDSYFSTDLSSLTSEMVVSLTSFLVSQFSNYQTRDASKSASSGDFYENPGHLGSYDKYFTDLAIDYAFVSENNVTFGSTIHNSLYFDAISKAADNGLSWHSKIAFNAKDQAFKISLGANTGETGGIESMFPIVNPVTIVFPEDGEPNATADNQVAISCVGYIVEKYVASPDTIEYTGGLDDNPHIMISPYADGNTLTDSDVTYGHAYNYSVRAVYLTQVPIINRSLIDPIDDQFGYAYVLVTSKPNFSNGIQAIDTTPPPPPGNIEFIYNYSDKTLFMHWEMPTNPQEDIVAFQVFRRETSDEPFELIAQYDFDTSIEPYPQIEKFILSRLVFKTPGKPNVSHTDYKFDKESKYIYSVCSVDARRLSSGYSSQYEVTFDRYRNKLVVKRSSFPGAPKPYPNLYLIKDTFKDTIQTSEYDDFFIFFDPDAYHVYDESGTNLNLISTSIDSQPKPSYHMNVINLDMQKSETVNITINDDDAILSSLDV